MYMSLLPAHRYTYHTQPWCLQRSEEISDPLEPQVVVSHHIGIGTEPGSSERATDALTTAWSISPDPSQLRFQDGFVLRFRDQVS